MALSPDHGYHLKKSARLLMQFESLRLCNPDPC